MNHYFKQKGFALITALVVLALVTSVTVAMAKNQVQGVELTTNVIRNNQLRHHGDAVMLWANGVLIDDIKQSNIDSQNEIWNAPLKNVEINGGKVNAYITDLQGKFNLNNLILEGETGTLAKSRFKRLLKNLGIEIDISDAIADWIDSDIEVRFPNGAEDDYYLSLEKPYRTANQVFVSISEVLLVKGVTREIFFKLYPYVTVLPAGTGININTASDEILLSLSEDMNEAGVEALKNIRGNSPFTSIENETTDAESSSEEDSSSNQTSSNDTTSNTTGSLSTTEKTNLRLYNEWFWSSQQKQQNNTDNQQQAKLNSSSSNEVAEVQPQSLSGAGLDEYGIDMKGLSVSSSYFRVSGEIQQYDQTINVEYILQRQQDKITLIARNYNGMNDG